MAILSKELRRQLEKTIAGENGARQIAEAGAEQSLERLAVDRHEPHGSLTPDERTLRNQLRAHGRQLGDKRDTQRGTQTITHLKQAVAYEHWHRMLFARFLAENDLLLHPNHGVALSLDEVRELALGLTRDWIEVAAEYAQRMLLRQVFRPDDPSLRVPLPREKRLELEVKLDSLPKEIFVADDSLGWVYQFWQRDAKEAVLDSEVKIGADELAPVTQLFTEDYMVLFLLENTLGAWWTAQRGTSDLPGYTWTYLRLCEDGIPAAGTFDGWPKTAKELRVLDPCMGSGHFLTFALPILSRMRAADEGLSLAQAITAVLRDNLFGLELDPRCSQIAAFNLALTAWKLGGQHFNLPPLNLACSGLGINAKEDDWVKLAGADGRTQDLMRWLYSLFSNASTLGSLIDPTRVGKPMVEDEIGRLLPLLEQALSAEGSTDETRELAIAAEGLLAAVRILTERFTLVATNVPYLGRRKQDRTIKSYCDDFHAEARADLSTCFVERTLASCTIGGTAALVTPQNWLFLTTYATLRRRLLKSHRWDFVVRLGPNAFQDMNWWAATTSLVGLTRCQPTESELIAGFDVSVCKMPSEKADALQSCDFRQAAQHDQVRNANASIQFDQPSDLPPLSDFAYAPNGSHGGDALRHRRFYWELPRLHQDWRPFQGTVEETVAYGGREQIFSWANNGRNHSENPQARIQGEEVLSRRGVSVSMMRALPVTLYTGELFDISCTPIVPHNPDHLAAVWAYCTSNEYRVAVRKIDQKVSVTNATLAKVPFDLERWSSVAKEEYPAGLPAPSSADPTQWLFNGQPEGSHHPLQVAVLRLLDYSWPRQTGSSFLDCPALCPDELQLYVDSDGIVCLPPISGADPAATRIRTLLQAAYGTNYNLNDLLAHKRSARLEEWVRDEFFEEHCRVFHMRPFIWHVWDGLTDGFHALVNYHRLDRKNLEKLTYSYLGDWLRRRRDDAREGVEGADTRLAAAEHLQSELRKILHGEAPYDIFVRWKSVKEQPIGWEPDLSDGVRVNIRPWITEARLYKATKPGILRVMPNIKYTKDRGLEPTRDPNEFPWFKGSTDRVNDHHLSLEVKRQARGL
jgi:hypothetical protein